ncbi:transglycosylase domain-containing protein [Pyxidicoccus xibeiensis]|uniref:transglycosylase domain-containing protein n=1 Tax=Pyxidicoccus xibeiensis TaxID=2906759 RepID=UPI0020A7FB8E|nr:transglycosylase domain-containing protein [Pyxidicoccus xibeiensis]MCP3139619.1 transglycosylase domain-containing protein [Pyxidicoccus xibeiensis]
MRWRRLLKWWVCLLGLGFVGVLATLEGFYRVMLARVPELPRPPETRVMPALYGRMRWASSERTATPRVEPVWPWNVAFVLVRVGLLGQKPSQVVMPAGLGIAQEVASEWSSQLREAGGRFPRTFERLALTLWLTRHWSAEELLAFEAEHRSLGHGLFGMRAGARVLLGREWAELDAGGMAVLLAVGDAPGRWRDPWCFPERIRARRDVLLKRLREAGGLSLGETEAALQAPLGLIVRPAHWAPCPERNGSGMKAAPEG